MASLTYILRCAHVIRCKHASWPAFDDDIIGPKYIYTVTSMTKYLQIVIQRLVNLNFFCSLVKREICCFISLILVQKQWNALLLKVGRSKTPRSRSHPRNINQGFQSRSVTDHAREYKEGREGFLRTFTKIFFLTRIFSNTSQRILISIFWVCGNGYRPPKMFIKYVF